MGFFKFGSFDFPEKYVEWDGIDAAPNQRQDLDSYTDGYGVTQRNALAHTKTQVQFKTIPVSAAAMQEIMSGITSNYINAEERDANCTYYDDEYQTFKTGHFYLDPSVSFKTKQKNKDGTPKKYGEMTWTFIEY